MQTRRDQVQAHSFMVRRLSTAMAAADPNAVEAPLRRTRNGTLIGLILAVLLCVGFLVFGLIFPGGATSWRNEGTLVVVKDGAGRYVFSDGVLWPVTNQASALLLASNPTPVRVDADSLEGTPVGSPLGIPGAPDGLPATDAEGSMVWQVCATTVDTGEGVETLTSLTLGRSPFGSPVGEDDGVLVRGPGGGIHLLWQGARLAVDEENGALESLGYGTVVPHPVAAAVLDGVPAGPGLTALDVEGRGEDGPRVGGVDTRIGQVFTVPANESGSEQFYVLTGEGLTPTDPTHARLLLGHPLTAEEAYGGGEAEPIELTVNELRPHLSGEDAITGDGLPATPPPLTDPQGAALCVIDQGDGALALALTSPADIGGRAARPTVGSTAACTAPDLIDIPSGEGGLVRATPAGGSALRGSYFLITDTGSKYPVPDADAAGMLGYTPGEAPAVSTALLDLLPTGPDLTPQDAAEPAGALAEPGEPRCLSQ
ncbi:type VII secretion protein EccB [Nocardiopsis alba]|uniref:Type VII secretion protein EccB n=1 Tax=Nocardiopsis alba TaxID=53437 RepID=A0A7K2ITA1_9ACTN|nr:type VII secretion protein EccB [Nocardiopsis alba]MYR33077.1 type VII secretion protein EccB [Nocardiopsis alba]